MSSKFLKTATYQKCEAAQEIVPHITLGPVVPDTWGIADFPEIGSNILETMTQASRLQVTP